MARSDVERNREWRRRNPDKAKEQNRRARKRLKADPVKWKRMQESMKACNGIVRTPPDGGLVGIRREGDKRTFRWLLKFWKLKR